MTSQGFVITPLVLLTALFLPASAQNKKKVKTTTIEAVEGLRFSPVRFSMRQDEQLKLKFVNKDPNDQPHNLAIIKPGSLKAIQDASLKIGPDSIENDYIPENDAILAAIGLLETDQEESLTFEPTGKGVYPFVCTFPGHAAIMYGAIYVDQRPPKDLISDTNIPQIIRDQEMQKLKESLAVERPHVMRAFLPNAGPAAIAVALPGDLNFCWDAGTCRPRYAWSGAFVDPRAMLNSNGSRFTQILGPEFWSAGGDENTFGIKLDDPKARPDFKGYRLLEGIPEFHYTLGELDVRERLYSEEGQLRWHFSIKGASDPVKIYAPGAVTTTRGTREGDFLVVGPKSAQNLILTIKSSS